MPGFLIKCVVFRTNSLPSNNRLKTRRARGKLTADEWNVAVALALEYKDKAEAGEISDFDLKEIYDKM